MKRSTDRILTTHSGSLVRPPGLMELMKVQTLGDAVDEVASQATIAAGVEEVVRRQVEAGIDLTNDGEYARRNFKTYIGDRLSGLERSELRPGETNPVERKHGWNTKGEREQFPGFYAQYFGSAQFAWLPPEVDMTGVTELRSQKGRDRAEVVYRLVGPVTYRHAGVDRDIAHLRAALNGLDAVGGFITAVTATNVTRQDAGILDFYESFEAYQYAIADALREEYRAITNAGFILQLDRPALDPMSRDDGEAEIAKALDAAIEIENYALRGIPEERTRLHWCAGGSNRPHVNDIPMAKMAKAMLRLNVGGYGFEAANPRHEHEWQIWQDIRLPEGKTLIPGVISQSTNVVEHPELVAWRIKNFARIVGRESVIAGVDCGFSQGWDIPRTHPEIQWAKLRALAEGARIASDDLWKRASSVRN